MKAFHTVASVGIAALCAAALSTPAQAEDAAAAVAVEYEDVVVDTVAVSPGTMQR